MATDTIACLSCATFNPPETPACLTCGAGLRGVAVSGEVSPCALQLKAEGPGFSFPLLTSPLIVGRYSERSGPVDLDLALVADAAAVSRHHALIYFDAGHWHVQDLGSANGTFVGKAGGALERLQATAAVAPGDEVAFGDLVFVLERR